MQNAGLQYGEGVTPVQESPFVTTPVQSNSSSNSTSSLRQFRKKDVDKTAGATGALSGTSQDSTNSSHVARVAPHNHYPHKQNEYFRYPSQYQEYTSPYKEPTVKYSEIAEPVIQSIPHLDHLPPSVLTKHKEKEYVEMCNIPQQNHLNKPYPEHQFNGQQAYPSEMSMHHQYIHKEPQGSQMHSPYKPESQYIPKDGSFNHQMPPFLKYNIPQSRNYGPLDNSSLTPFQRMDPHLARSFMTEHHHIRDFPTEYNPMEQTRMYAQKQRYYPSPLPPSNSAYPTNYPHRNMPTQQYNYPSCNYPRSTQMNRYPMNMERSISPRRTYTENMDMGMNFPHVPQKIQTGYPNYPAYAQHYQQRRPQVVPQEYYHHQQHPHARTHAQYMPNHHSQEMQENHVASNNIRQYLENWAEEEPTNEIPSSIENPKYISRMNRDETNEVYVINASELPQYLENGVPLIASENGQYIFKSNVSIDNTGAIKILDKTGDTAVLPTDTQERVVSLHIIENPKTDCLVNRPNVNPEQQSMNLVPTNSNVDNRPYNQAGYNRMVHQLPQNCDTSINLSLHQNPSPRHVSRNISPEKPENDVGNDQIKMLSYNEVPQQNSCIVMPSTQNRLNFDESLLPNPVPCDPKKKGNDDENSIISNVINEEAILKEAHEELDKIVQDTLTSTNMLQHLPKIEEKTDSRIPDYLDLDLESNPKDLRLTPSDNCEENETIIDLSTTSRRTSKSDNLEPEPATSKPEKDEDKKKEEEILKTEEETANAVKHMPLIFDAFEEQTVTKELTPTEDVPENITASEESKHDNPTAETSDSNPIPKEKMPEPVSVELNTEEVPEANSTTKEVPEDIQPISKCEEENPTETKEKLTGDTLDSTKIEDSEEDKEISHIPKTNEERPENQEEKDDKAENKSEGSQEGNTELSQTGVKRKRIFSVDDIIYRIGSTSNQTQSNQEIGDNNNKLNKESSDTDFDTKHCSDLQDENQECEQNTGEVKELNKTDTEAENAPCTVLQQDINGVHEINEVKEQNKTETNEEPSQKKSDISEEAAKIEETAKIDEKSRINEPTNIEAETANIEETTKIEETENKERTAEKEDAADIEETTEIEETKVLEEAGSKEEIAIEKETVETGKSVEIEKTESREEPGKKDEAVEEHETADREKTTKKEETEEKKPEVKVQETENLPSEFPIQVSEPTEIEQSDEKEAISNELDMIESSEISPQKTDGKEVENFHIKEVIEETEATSNDENQNIAESRHEETEQISTVEMVVEQPYEDLVENMVSDTKSTENDVSISSEETVHLNEEKEEGEEQEIRDVKLDEQVTIDYVESTQKEEKEVEENESKPEENGNFSNINDTEILNLKRCFSESSPVIEDQPDKESNEISNKRLKLDTTVQIEDGETTPELQEEIKNQQIEKDDNKPSRFSVIQRTETAKNDITTHVASENSAENEPVTTTTETNIENKEKEDAIIKSDDKLVADEESIPEIQIQATERGELKQELTEVHINDDTVHKDNDLVKEKRTSKDEITFEERFVAPLLKNNTAETLKTDEEDDKSASEDFQYRSVLKIEENVVLLEICGELVEISVNQIHGKKVITVVPLSNSATVDINDNYEHVDRSSSISEPIATSISDENDVPELCDEIEKPNEERLPEFVKMMEETSEEEEEKLLRNEEITSTQTETVEIFEDIILNENEIIIGDESLEEEINLDLKNHEELIEEKPVLCTKAAKKLYDDSPPQISPKCSTSLREFRKVKTKTNQQPVQGEKTISDAENIRDKKSSKSAKRTSGRQKVISELKGDSRDAFQELIKQRKMRKEKIRLKYPEYMFSEAKPSEIEVPDESNDMVGKEVKSEVRKVLPCMDKNQISSVVHRVKTSNDIKRKDTMDVHGNKTKSRDKNRRRSLDENRGKIHLISSVIIKESFSNSDIDKKKTQEKPTSTSNAIPNSTTAPKDSQPQNFHCARVPNVKELAKTTTVQEKHSKFSKTSAPRDLSLTKHVNEHYLSRKDHSNLKKKLSIQEYNSRKRKLEESKVLEVPGKVPKMEMEDLKRRNEPERAKPNTIYSGRHFESVANHVKDPRRLQFMNLGLQRSNSQDSSSSRLPNISTYRSISCGSNSGESPTTIENLLKKNPTNLKISHPDKLYLDTHEQKVIDTTYRRRSIENNDKKYESSGTIRRKVSFDDNVQINEIHTTQTRAVKIRQESNSSYCEVTSSCSDSFEEKRTSADSYSDDANSPVRKTLERIRNDWEDSNSPRETITDVFEDSFLNKNKLETLKNTPKSKLIIDINDFDTSLIDSELKNSYRSNSSASSGEEGLKNYKEEVDIKLNSLNLQIPKLTKTRVSNEDDILMHKFLRKEQLTSDEIKQIRRIIYFKKKMQQIQLNQQNNISKPTEETYEVSDTSTNKDLKLQLKKIDGKGKRKKKRFRNLYSNSPETSENEIQETAGEFSVYGGENISGVKLIFKRKTDFLNLQPVVRLQRFKYIDSMAKKLKSE